MTNQTSNTQSSTTQLQALTFNSVGQLQTQRDSLSRAQFYVEQRHFADWVNYLRTIAKEIRFFDDQKKIATGTWQPALPSAEQALGLQQLMDGDAVSTEIKVLANRPDIASLMAYYHMLRYPIAQVQRFTQQHVDYYYQEVLGFKPKVATPDRAHLVLKLDETAQSVTLLKGAQFDGGEDSAGNPLIYEILNNAQFNQAQVDKVLSLSRLSDGGQLLLTEAVNLEEDIEMPAEGIMSFGEAALSQNADLIVHQNNPEQGIELSSSCFYLSGGERKLEIEFILSNASQNLPAPLAELFTLSISTAEGLVSLQSSTEHVSLSWSGNKLTITLNALFVPITVFESELPKIQLLLKPQWLALSSMQQMRRGLFTCIHLKTTVSELSGAVLGQAGNVLDGEAPFNPFGLSPRTASRFDFTHPELLCKSIEQAHINFSWLDRPDNWDDYYFAYRVYQNQHIDYSNVENWGLYPPLEEFNANVLYSDQEGVQTSGDLFSHQMPVNNVDQHALTFINKQQAALTHYAALPLTEKQPTQWPKYFTLQLNQPDFGHQLYTPVGQYAAQLNSKHFTNTEYTPLLVFPPYTPLLEKMTLNYTSQAEFSGNDIGDTNIPAGALTAHHIHPLGRPVVRMESSGFSLLPRFDLRGYLYLGINQLSLPGQVRVYFQLDPVDNSNIVNNPRIDWHYLTDQGWQFFDSSVEGSARIVEDSTFQLLDSGVVTFEFPKLEFANNFIDGKRLWIRIGIAADSVIDDENHARYSRIRHISSQGVEVQLRGDNIAEDHYQQPLPEESITGMINGTSDVVEVIQPYASYGAKPEESKTALQVRASERLRHKQRALLAWDYERLVLAEFPQLYLVRCFSVQAIDQAPVALVVVPINHNPSILQPKVPLYLKKQIQRFVNSVSPDGVSIAVKDPVYEEVKISLYAQISPEFDKERVEGELNQLLLDTMTPWNQVANETNKEGNGFRKELALTYLAQQLETHPALEKVYVIRAQQSTETGMLYYPKSEETSSDHQFRSDNLVTASHPQSILVPAKVHDINLFNHYQPIFEGIGKWRLELDWKVR